MQLLNGLEKITTKSLSNLSFKHKKSTTGEILEYALSKNICVYKVFEDRFIFILKKGSKVFWINKALTSKANPVSTLIAKDKKLTVRLLKKMGYPVAPSEIVSNIVDLERTIQKIPFPVVIKPLGSSGGKGITINIRTKKTLIESFKIAKTFDKKILVEKFVEGDYYRLTYVADGSYAVTKNIPAHIIGDGEKTAKELIVNENNHNKERKKNGRLKKITMAEKAKRFLASEGYTLNSVIPKGKQIPLCFSGFDGGEYINVTDDIDPYFIKMAARITKLLDLPIIGIDIITKNIKKTLDETGGVILEINGTFPDIQFHSMPTQGDPINLAPKLIDYLFK